MKLEDLPEIKQRPAKAEIVFADKHFGTRKDLVYVVQIGPHPENQERQGLEVTKTLLGRLPLEPEWIYLDQIILYRSLDKN